jgi:hypothetical protein
VGAGPQMWLAKSEGPPRGRPFLHCDVNLDVLVHRILDQASYDLEDKTATGAANDV